MQRHYPQIPCERFADDVICHCASAAQAQELRVSLARRFADCGLELHPQKTKIVYCKDDDRRGTYPEEHFDFLGYAFRPRRSKNRWGKYFINFSPGVSHAAAKAIRQAIRRWQPRCRMDKQLDDLARMFNPITVPDPPAPRPATGQVGDGEIHTRAATSAAGIPSAAGTVRALASLACGG